MHRALLVAATLLATAAPAAATEWIHCGDAEETVSIGVLAGFFDFLNISAATLRVGTDEWSSSPTYGPGEPVGMAQGFDDGGQLLIDLSDGDNNEILAELRVFKAEEGTEYVQAGVLRVPGRGVWIVSCEGP
jgi:hypothetical protein